jgi:phosphoribosyl 1,2-cyclic phosphodiesterase
MLIDIGLGPLTIKRRLATRKMRLDQIEAVCLTHLDHDHFRPYWVATLLKLKMRIFIHRWHQQDMEIFPGGVRLIRAGLVRVFENEPFEPLAEVTVRPLRLAHDTKGTCCFRIETAGGHVGYATDLGHVPSQLIEHFTGVEVLAIESNYDCQMQLSSNRPLFLKRRIMGRRGHLSNEEAFGAVCRILDRSPNGNPLHIVLLHRSAQCNRPDLVRQIFRQDARVRSRLKLAEQRCPSPWLSASPPAARREQLEVGF